MSNAITSSPAKTKGEQHYSQTTSTLENMRLIYVHVPQIELINKYIIHNVIIIIIHVIVFIPKLHK